MLITPNKTTKIKDKIENLVYIPNPYIVKRNSEQDSQQYFIDILTKCSQNDETGTALVLAKEFCPLVNTDKRPVDRKDAKELAKQNNGKIPIVLDPDNRSNGILEKFAGKPWFDNSKIAEKLSKVVSFNSHKNWLSNLLRCVFTKKTAGHVGSPIEVNCDVETVDGEIEILTGRIPKGGNRVIGYTCLYSPNGIEIFDEYGEWDECVEDDFLTKLFDQNTDGIDLTDFFKSWSDLVKSGNDKFRRLSLSILEELSNKEGPHKLTVNPEIARKVHSLLKNALIPVHCNLDKTDRQTQIDVEDEQEYTAVQTKGHKNKRKFSNRVSRKKFEKLQDNDMKEIITCDENYTKNSEKMKMLTTQTPPTRFMKRFSSDKNYDFKDFQRNYCEAMVNACVHADREGFVKPHEIGSAQLSLLTDLPGDANYEYEKKCEEYINEPTFDDGERTNRRNRKKKEFDNATDAIFVVETEIANGCKNDDTNALRLVDDSSVALATLFIENLGKLWEEIEDVKGSKRLFIGSSENYRLRQIKLRLVSMYLDKQLPKKSIYPLFKELLSKESCKKFWIRMEDSNFDKVFEKFDSKNKEKKTSWLGEVAKRKAKDKDAKNLYQSVYFDTGETELGTGTIEIAELHNKNDQITASEFNPNKHKETTKVRKTEIFKEFFGSGSGHKLKMTLDDNQNPYAEVNMPNVQRERAIKRIYLDGTVEDGVQLGHQGPESMGFKLDAEYLFGFIENEDANNCKRTSIHHAILYFYNMLVTSDEGERVNTEQLILATINTTKFKGMITIEDILNVGEKNEAKGHIITKKSDELDVVFQQIKEITDSFISRKEQKQ